MTCLRLLSALSSVAFCTALATSAPADDDARQPSSESSVQADAVTEKASELFWQAHEQYKLGHYAEAIRLFRESYALVPEPETLFNIALANARNGNCKEAERGYTEYSSLVESTRGAKAKPFPEDVECAPELAEPATVTPEEFPGELDTPAEPAAASAAPTTEASRVNLTTLQPGSAVAEARPPVAESADASGRTSIVGWSLVGGSAVAAGASFYFVARELSARDAAREAADSGDGDAGDRTAEHEEQASHARTGAIVSGVIALGLAAAGVGVLLSGENNESQNSASVALDVNDGLRLRVSGSF